MKARHRYVTAALEEVQMRRRWSFRRSQGDREPALAAAVDEAAGGHGVETSPVEIAPNDPLVAYFQSATGPVDLDALELDSPAVADLRAAGARMVVPLVSQGELIGLLNLGPRRSEQE
jgi:GAF domain-containing protein